ncbi:hypothetical protein J6590_049598 [Homalodisca vitripennis]|nr:hypothetical protein J6590_049598 [Homalodisca vitripennis]
MNHQVLAVNEDCSLPRRRGEGTDRHFLSYATTLKRLQTSCSSNTLSCPIHPPPTPRHHTALPDKDNHLTPGNVNITHVVYGRDRVTGEAIADDWKSRFTEDAPPQTESNSSNILLPRRWILGIGHAEASTRRRGPSSGEECDKHLLASVISAVWIVSRSRRFTYPGSLRFGVRLAVKRQWSGQGIERAGDCRAVVGILGEGGITAAESYLPQPA